MKGILAVHYLGEHMLGTASRRRRRGQAGARALLVYGLTRAEQEQVSKTMPHTGRGEYLAVEAADFPAVVDAIETIRGFRKPVQMSVSSRGEQIVVAVTP